MIHSSSAMRRACCWILSSLCSLCLCGEFLRADELHTPYNLHVVVHTAPNRVLTDVFRERIERQLRDGFGAALGDMGRVTVSRLDPRDPRQADVLARGLEASLNGWKGRDDRKTHFVLIDFADGYYDIQARQYDGTLGRPSPVVRRQRTPDRDFVARAAALLVRQDFGVLGTVRTPPEGPRQLTTVELRGGALGDLGRWVQKDDVFALVPPGGGAPAALRWALLQVEKPPDAEQPGLCVCRFFHRYQVPNIGGYRCVKLGTVQAPLRLRWMQETPRRGLQALALPGVRVEIRRHGFDGEDATLLTKDVDGRCALDTSADGDKGVFSNVAFVRVVGGMGASRPQVPVALLDDQPVIVEANVKGDPGTLITVQKDAWRSDVADSWLVQTNLFKHLEALGAKGGPRDEIIREAEAGLQRSRGDLDRLRQRKTELEDGAKKSGIRLDTRTEDRRLKQIEQGAVALEDFLAKQKKIEETENDPQRRKWQSEIAQAKLLEKDLEIGKAIAIYERIKKEGFEDKGLDDHLEELRKLWKVAGAEHQAARRFIYRVWPTLDTAGLDKNLPEAQKAFEACKKAGDVIALRKLLKGTEGHADRLAKELGELNPELVIDHVKPAQYLKEVSAKVIKLGQEVVGYLKSKSEPDDV